METASDIVLGNVSESVEAGEYENYSGNDEFFLPEVDGGTAAWLFLAACFTVEALVWGFPFSFGVFQDYYTQLKPFSENPNGIAAIGTTATGVMYMAGLVLFPAYIVYPRLPNMLKWAGLPIMAAGLICASFCDSVLQLIATQGVVYAIGGSIVYYPTLVWLDEWFIQRKGFAYGIMWAGTGAAGMVIPFVMNWLLSSYGFRTTLRIWAITLLTISSPLIYFLRPRVPISRVSVAARQGLGFLRTSPFWVLAGGFVVSSLGYFIPSIYLPTFARSLGLSPSIGTMLVALVNASAVFSTVTMGWLIDRFHVTTVILLSTIGASISVFLLWGLATALPLLIVFSIMYGFFAGGLVSTIAGMIKVVKQRDETANVGILLGLLSAGRGIGAVISGPLSEKLLCGSPWEGEAGLAYGSGFGSLIVFTGVTATVGGLSFFGRRLGWV